MVHIGPPFNSRTFGSLSQVILCLRLEMSCSDFRNEEERHILELKRNLMPVLPHVNDLFPFLEP